MKRILVALAVVAAVATAVYAAPEAGGPYTLVAWNDLGMHCMDADFSVFSLLPPYNTFHAQLIDGTGHLVTNPVGITVTYEAFLDPGGSINKSSVGKTNFWMHMKDFFGVQLPVDTGLKGFKMPGASNTPQAMAYDTAVRQWFSAEGLPITPNDDSGHKNYYPMMHLVARDAGGAVLATTDIVLPVSDEMTCKACHSSGTQPAARPAIGWAWNADPEKDFRLNVLLLHDEVQGSKPAYASALHDAHFDPKGLYVTATTRKVAILCAACHGSNALAPGLSYVPPLTRSVHSAHSFLDNTGTRTACYQCHPGSQTRCLRGAMGSAVATDGTLQMQCQSCHGTMGMVGAPTRNGWFEEPACQQCHTGTAMSNNGQIRYTTVFETNGLPRVPVDSTFATNDNQPATGLNLYRFSRGHGNLYCEACHGSTHAEQPTLTGNDGLQNTEIQGHVGMLIECASCHKTVPTTVNGGPHGMHPVGQSWGGAHHDSVGDNPAPCKVCHGNDYKGTVLSRAQTIRTITTENFGTKYLWRGFQVSCYMCHNGPRSESPSPNHAPVATNSTTSTAGLPVTVNLVATDSDGNALTYRIVDQPKHGTSAITGTTATYYPDAGYVGSDSLTWAAWDGFTNSNLATITVSVTAGCTLSCSASGPPNAAQGASALFNGSALPSAACTGALNYDWSFGDQTPHATQQNPAHIYNLNDSFLWTMTASIGGASCTQQGTLRVSSDPKRVPYYVKETTIATADHGQSATLAWDSSNCPSSGYHLVYGYGSGLPAQTVTGGACGLGTSGSWSWSSLPDPRSDSSRLLWFLVVGDNAATEGSWGLTSAGAERGGTTPSGQCGVTIKNSLSCTAP